MKNIEEQLKACELAPPSPALDRRIELLLANAPAPRWRFLSRPVALWQCAAACLLCAFAGYWCQVRAGEGHLASAPPGTPATVYIIQPGAPLPENAFRGTTHRVEGLDRPAESRITYPAPPEPTHEKKENHA